MTTARAITKTTLAALAAAGLVLGGQSAASAQPTQDDAAALAGIHFAVSSPKSPYKYIDIYNGNGQLMGEGYWSQNPGGDLNGDGKSDPGDSALAVDALGDGWYTTVSVTSGISISTSGHTAYYISPWHTKNVAEGHNYTMTVCMHHSGTSSCAHTTVTS